MWKEQSGERVETGIEGTGTTPDHWKYIRKEMQELGMTVPVRVQMDIDSLCEGDAIPMRKLLADQADGSKGDEFIQELTKLCRKHDRYLVGPEGLVVATASEARNYNAGHRPIKGVYEMGEWKQKCWAAVSLY
jgi:predicted GNAT family acetyltransferase